MTWLIAMQIAVSVWYIVESMRVSRLKRVVSTAAKHDLDDMSGFLAEGGIAFRLVPEIRWARRENVAIGVLVFAGGSIPERTSIATELRSAMRRYESGYIISDTECAVALWDVTAESLALARGRLLQRLSDGLPIETIGWSIYPVDGNDPDALFHAARRRKLPYAPAPPQQLPIREARAA